MPKSSVAHRFSVEPLGRFRTQIVAEWQSVARGMASATRLPRQILIDRIPELLDQVAELAEQLERDPSSTAALDTARRHALERVRDGFSLSDVVTELSLLRLSIATVWQREHVRIADSTMRALHLAIDRAIAASATCYAEARERRELADRKRMEDELTLAIRSRDDVLAIVSHDLRNPLGAIELTATMLLTNAGNDERTTHQLELIRRAASSTKRMIQDLLDSVVIQAGRLAIAARPEPAAALVQEVIDRHESLAAEKGISIAPEGKLDHVAVLCDRERVLQVFSNLVGNAIKFGRSGDTITIGGEVAGDSVRFSVADTGPGIARDRIAQLFDPYWSAPEHAARGTGLGLYIAKGIVEAHDGEIWVESTPGRGTRFLFTLPLTS
jgi:signal transduction histidine kinase